MAKQAQTTTPWQASPDEIDAVLAEFDGDARTAIAALLHDLAALADDAQAVTSRGYVWGRFLRPVKRGKAGAQGEG